jgi:hypothetical protein
MPARPPHPRDARHPHGLLREAGAWTTGTGRLGREESVGRDSAVGRDVDGMGMGLWMENGAAAGQTPLWPRRPVGRFLSLPS